MRPTPAAPCISAMGRPGSSSCPSSIALCRAPARRSSFLWYFPTMPWAARATSLAIVQAALFSIRDNLLTLHAAGARQFLVPNAPDIGLAPAVRLLGPAAQGAATFLSAQFNGGLEAILQGLESALGVEIVRVDGFRMLNEVVAAPQAFRLTDATHPCIALNTRAHAFCASPNKFLFWDGIHPTVAGHRILAHGANAALGAASSLAATP